MNEPNRTTTLISRKPTFYYPSRYTFNMLRTTISAARTRALQSTRTPRVNVGRAMLSTQAPPQPSAPSGSSKALLYAALGVVLGLAAGQSPLFDSFKSGSTDSAAMFGKFGTHEDFKAAIAELQRIFPGEKASTDPHVVQEHGFSANVRTCRLRVRGAAF